MGRKSYWTYILASRTRVLYIGVTNNLNRRLAEHRAGVGTHSVAHRRNTETPIADTPGNTLAKATLKSDTTALVIA